MAATKPWLKVILAPSAIDELDGIWRWNVRTYNVRHANEYLNFLEERIASLSSEYGKGKRTNVRPDLLYQTMQRKSKAHGHVVVYRVAQESIDVLHVFHTAQDWRNRLDEME
jgi:plasmid stabilization system protein ParE